MKKIAKELLKIAKTLSAKSARQSAINDLKVVATFLQKSPKSDEYMTVSELIEELSQFPGDTQISTSYEVGGNYTPTKPSIKDGYYYSIDDPEYDFNPDATCIWQQVDEDRKPSVPIEDFNSGLMLSSEIVTKLLKAAQVESTKTFSTIEEAALAVEQTFGLSTIIVDSVIRLISPTGLLLVLIELQINNDGTYSFFGNYESNLMIPEIEEYLNS